MLSLKDHLDSRLVAGLHTGVRWQRNLGEADCAGVRVVGGTEDAESRHHDVGHVLGAAIGAISAVAEIDRDFTLEVAVEPTWLEGDGTTFGGPVGTVVCCLDTTTCEMEISVFIMTVVAEWGVGTYRDSPIAYRMAMFRW